MDTLLACLWLLAATISPALAQSDEVNRLLRERSCMACHVWEQKMVGPSFNQIRARYGSSDVAFLAAKVRNGGSGSWGAIPKPSDSRISQAEAEYLVAGILGLPLGPSPLPLPAQLAPVLPDDPPSVGRVFRLNQAPAQAASARYMTAQEAVMARNDQASLLRAAARRKQVRTSDKVKAFQCINWHKGPSGEVGLANKCEVDAAIELCALDAAASEVLSCEGGGYGLLVLPARTEGLSTGPIVYITGVEANRRWTAWGCESPYAPYATRYTPNGLHTVCARIKGR